MMNASSAHLQHLHNVTKQDSRQASCTSPPPAYSPNRRIDLQVLTARHIQQSRSSEERDSPDSPMVMAQLPLTTTLLNSHMDDHDDTESTEGLSAISLRINTSVSISNNGNLVCLSETPANNANAIARAVVKAVEENSSGQCGIPMIDEDGRPRPVKIEVDAGIVVDGANNVVGNEQMINEVLRQRRSLRRQREDDDEQGGPATPIKRRCSTRET